MIDRLFGLCYCFLFISMITHWDGWVLFLARPLVLFLAIAGSSYRGGVKL